MTRAKLLVWTVEGADPVEVDFNITTEEDTAMIVLGPRDVKMSTATEPKVVGA